MQWPSFVMPPPDITHSDRLSASELNAGKLRNVPSPPARPWVSALKLLASNPSPVSNQTHAWSKTRFRLSSPQQD